MIPKRIHYCWFGGASLPNEVLVCINSWKKFCPEYEIIRWDESNYDVNKYAFTKEAYERKKWAFVSDVARLEIIYRYGGIYLDTDVELIKPLDSLLNNEAYMGFEQGRSVATGLGFGAVKGHPVIKGNLEQYIGEHFLDADGNVKILPCPVITTRYLEGLGLKRLDEKQKIAGLTVYPSEFFSPELLTKGRAKIYPETISIHRFAGTWTTDDRKRKEYRRIWFYTYFGVLGRKLYDGYLFWKSFGTKKFLRRFCETILRVKWK